MTIVFAYVLLTASEKILIDFTETPKDSIKSYFTGFDSDAPLLIEIIELNDPNLLFALIIKYECIYGVGNVIWDTQHYYIKKIINTDEITQKITFATKESHLDNNNIDDKIDKLLLESKKIAHETRQTPTKPNTPHDTIFNEDNALPCEANNSYEIKRILRFETLRVINFEYNMTREIADIFMFRNCSIFIKSGHYINKDVKLHFKLLDFINAFENVFQCDGSINLKTKNEMFDDIMQKYENDCKSRHDVNVKIAKYFSNFIAKIMNLKLTVIDGYIQKERDRNFDQYIETCSTLDKKVIIGEIIINRIVLIVKCGTHI